MVMFVEIHHRGDAACALRSRGSVRAHADRRMGRWRLAREGRDIHSGVAEHCRDRFIDSSHVSLGKPRPARVLRENALSGCTISGHQPVNGVHSIQNTDVTKPDFSLTEFVEGVQQDRSLTAS